LLRLAARVALAVLDATLVLSLVGGIYQLTLPGVANAPILTGKILDAHHDPAGGTPPPSKLAAAVVAVEDEHFYSDPVVNEFDGIARAAVAALHTTGDPGGSTIPQQLAKQLYGSGTGFGSTLAEVALGLKLSFEYSHDQVLVMYLNAVYYGNGYWGDVAASRGYFGTSPNRLDWAEAAMLAGLLQAPSAYDPVTHSVLAEQRQREVLRQLVVNHWLTEAQAREASLESLPLRRARARAPGQRVDGSSR
jgi:penicillin-binding protein 1A